MKKAILHLLALLICLCNIGNVHSQNTEIVCEQKSNFLGGKSEGGLAFTIGEKGYVCMATTGQDCWEYDIEKDTWKKLADFPGESRKDAVVFTIGNKAYVSMGSNGNVDLEDLWEYDRATDHWKQKSKFPGGARYGCIGFSINGKGYVGLGENEQTDVKKNTAHNDLWEYDATADKWARKADFPESGRSDASVFVIKSQAYILFGVQETESAVSKKNVCVYNVETNTWTKDVDFPGSARTGATTFTLNNSGYVFGGGDGADKRFADLWEYNATSKSWTQQTPETMPVARNNAFCFVIDSVACLGTGKIKNSRFGSDINDFWCMRLRTNMDFPAKLLYQNNDRKVPLVQQGVSLVNQGKKVLQTTTTDSTGSFAFKKLDIDEKYVVVLAKNDKLPANAVVSIAKPNGKIVKDLEKDNDGQFAYEVSKLDFIDEDDSYFNLQYFMKSSDKNVTITSHISYPSGSSDLSDDARNILYQVIVSLKQYPTLKVEISSHTDAVGNEDENMALSDKRAQTVVAYIVSNGIDPKRISGKGYGSTKLLNKCGHGVKCSEEENMINRRTEFTFSKQ
jgi:outer membrane protein OmpA-like peptidoglycan-associated protein